MNKNSALIIALIMLSANLLRLINFSFPAFTAEEARIAHRGYTLTKYGTDELGRKFPFIFNSSDDYQLPAVSYITMIGVAIFGKSDLGVRIPFMLIGTVLVFLIYKIGNTLSADSRLGLISAFLVATSPTLIFLSKIPNEAIVLTFIFTLLFYLIINNKSLLLLLPTMLVTVLVSKFAWFLLLPFLILTWRFRQNINYKNKLTLFVFAVLLITSAFLVFLNIPQSKRSLVENNFTIFSDITIQNGINVLRGQGLESGWPNPIEKLLFNKLYFLIVGALHWLAQSLNLALYFGQFDASGKMNFSYLGAWTKVLIIPAIWGVFYIIRKGIRRERLLLLLPLCLTLPQAFIYPAVVLEFYILVLPFMAIIIAMGVIQIIQFRKNWIILGVFLVVFELIINMSNLQPEYKNTNSLRAGWIKNMVAHAYQSSQNNPIAISDDIVSDITTFINWYTDEGSKISNLNIDWPYKFRQYNLTNIKIIGFDNEFRPCGAGEKLTIYISKRDREKIQHEMSAKYTTHSQDYLGEDRVYLIDQGICLE